MHQEKKFINREISWLAFNYRVLQEAQDLALPLLERLKFMAIYASNLDEFFKVRVATLKKLRKLKNKTKKKLEEDPEDTLKKISKTINEQQEVFGTVFKNQIIPELNANNIFIIDEKAISREQKAYIIEKFDKEISPYLIPVILYTSKNSLFLKDQALYLAISLTKKSSSGKGVKRYAVMEIPVAKFGRFIVLPDKDGKKCVMFLDDVIRVCLPKLFPNYIRVKTFAIKLSRDAELDIEDDFKGSLLKKIKKSLKKRARGTPARFLYDPGMPKDFLNLLRKKTGIAEEDLIKGNKYHNFSDFMGFPDMGLKNLKFKPLQPLNYPQTKDVSIFNLMDKQDILVHLPYHSFSSTLSFFQQAATDPKVVSISATVYRLAKNSQVINALLDATRNGKLVTVFIELRARFDEESNIFWAQKLEEAGANVIYGMNKLKVHSKFALVGRREKDKISYYAHFSTGNYNEDTSKVYTDHGFFTADKRITTELKSVYNFFISKNNTYHFKHLLVAPFNMRDSLIDLIDQEIINAHKGKKAYVWLKLNNLQDKVMIAKLYEASKAGVKVRLLVRGICCLIPGVKNMSENIFATAIIDRYLEHGRLIIFCNNGKEKYYISSGDWMTNKLDRRIEIAVPVYNKKLKDELKNIMELQFNDNVKARIIDKQLNNAYLADSLPKLRSQGEMYEMLKNKP